MRRGRADPCSVRCPIVLVTGTYVDQTIAGRALAGADAFAIRTPDHRRMIGALEPVRQVGTEDAGGDPARTDRERPPLQARLNPQMCWHAQPAMLAAVGQLPASTPRQEDTTRCAANQRCCCGVPRRR